MSARHELAPGDRLGETLRVEALLGHGGMGAVYRARDDLLGPVAVKVLHGDLQDPELLARFAREGEVAARVGGQGGVARVHRAGQDGARRFLVLELVDGLDLDALVRRDGPLAPDDAALLVERLARTLERCHQLARRRVAVLAPARRGPARDGVERGRHVGPQRARRGRVAVADRVEHGHGRALERPAAGEREGQDRAQRAHVDPAVDRPAAELLGRHPRGRAEELARGRQALGGARVRGHAEVDEDRAAVGPDEHVLGLQVAVDDALDLAAVRAGARATTSRGPLVAGALAVVALLCAGAAFVAHVKRATAAQRALRALRALDGLDGADPDAPLLRAAFGADAAALEAERPRIDAALAALRERADALADDDRRAADALAERASAALGVGQEPLVSALASFARGAGSPGEVQAVAERAGASAAVARDLRDRAWALRLEANATEASEPLLLATRVEREGPPAGALAAALRAWCAARRGERLAEALASPGEHLDALRALRLLGASVGLAPVTSAEEAQLEAIDDERARALTTRLLRRDVAAIVGAWTDGGPDRPCPVGSPAQRLVTRLRDAAVKDAPREAIAFDAALREVADLEPTLEMRRLVQAALERGPSPPASLLVASARADTAVITAQHLGEDEVAALSASPFQAARLVALVWLRLRAPEDDPEAHRAVLRASAALLDAPRRDAGPTSLSRMLEQALRSAERVLNKEETLPPEDRALARRLYEAWRPAAAGPDQPRRGSPFREWLLIQHRLGTFAEGLESSTRALDAALRRDPPVPDGEEVRNLVAALGETYCLPPDEDHMPRADAGQRRALIALLERARAVPGGLGQTAKLEVALASARLHDAGDEAGARHALAALHDGVASGDWEVARTAAAMIARLDGPAAAAARLHRWAERAEPRSRVDLEARARRYEVEADRAIRPPR